MTISPEWKDLVKTISTHTLTWSVTLEATDVDNYVRISTHTLTWSVTNPKGEYWNYFYISTHTLTWSVTTDQMSNYGSYWDFNSHAHVERDADFPRLAEWIEHFNSHAHVERD